MRRRTASSQHAEKPAVGLWIRLAKCYGLLLNEVRHAQRTNDLTLAQFDVLAQLLRHPAGMTSGQLSKALLVTAGNVTGLVDRLCAQGFVTRETAEHDQRVALVRLTPVGKRIAAREVRRQEEFLDGLLGDLPVSGQRTLSTQLDLLRKTLESVQTTTRGR